MNNPVQVLLDEHQLIKEVVEAAKNSGSLRGGDESEYEKAIRSFIDFFRNYADKYHHHKEEIILFPEMGKRNEMMQQGVIKEMLENHEDFREMLGSVEKFLNQRNYMRVDQQMQYYCEALLDHIAVEDDEVFQAAESVFADHELENIYFRFSDCDRELGDEEKNRYEEIAKKLCAQITKAD